METPHGFLTVLVECMLTISVIDKDLSSPEMDLIRELVAVNWKEEFGNLDTFIHGVAQQLSERSTLTGISLEKQFQYYAEYLGKHLTKIQKEKVIQVIDQLILSDHFIDQREKQMAKYLKNKFELL